MNNKIIICGNIAGSGKDTVADYLVRQYGYNKLFFASEIYNMARNLFNMKGKDRFLLQRVGEKMREISPSVWVDYTFKQANDITNNEGKVVISDLRRQNEYEEALEQGYLPIRIVCDRDIAISRIIARDGVCDEKLLDNESETGTRGIDMIEITNNGTLKELYQKLDELIEKDFKGYIKYKQNQLRQEKFYRRYC